MVDINLMGVVHGCHYFLPRMIARGQGGHIVNVASMAGYLPNEATTAYSVTKAGVVSLSECLRIELRQHGIGVTAICPLQRMGRAHAGEALPRRNDGAAR